MTAFPVHPPPLEMIEDERVIQLRQSRHPATKRTPEAAAEPKAQKPTSEAGPNTISS